MTVLRPAIPPAAGGSRRRLLAGVLAAVVSVASAAAAVGVVGFNRANNPWGSDRNPYQPNTQYTLRIEVPFRPPGRLAGFNARHPNRIRVDVPAGWTGASCVGTRITGSGGFEVRLTIGRAWRCSVSGNRLTFTQNTPLAVNVLRGRSNLHQEVSFNVRTPGPAVTTSYGALASPFARAPGFAVDARFPNGRFGQGAPTTRAYKAPYATGGIAGGRPAPARSTDLIRTVLGVPPTPRPSPPPSPTPRPHPSACRPDQAGPLAQRICVVVPKKKEGHFVLTVPSSPITLRILRLLEGTHLRSKWTLNPVTITDTRPGRTNPHRWSISAVVTDFAVGDGQTVPGADHGWTFDLNLGVFDLRLPISAAPGRYVAAITITTLT